MKNRFIHKYIVDLTKYKIEPNVIGKGSFGEVHKAINKDDNSECAVKYFYPNFLTESKDQEKFANEVKCQALLDHMCVLHFVGFSLPYFRNKRYSIITEFMPHGSLNKLIEDANRGRSVDNWDTIKAINIFGIAAGMAYVHQHSIIHRDLKTENVMLDNNYFPKIADFGLSKIFEAGTQEQIQQTLQVGTPSYMAPEVLNNTHYTNKVDVFSYAVILYEILTENKPWHDKKNATPFNVLQYISNGLRPQIREREIPDVYVDLISKCWDQNPSSRPSFTKIVNELLDKKDQYFDNPMIDENALSNYMEEAVKGIDLNYPDDEFSPT